MERVGFAVSFRHADHERRARRASSWPITEKRPT